jgi:drug/metabolite transporter (DMT)-like permease
MEQTITSTTTKGLVIGLILIIISLAIYFANIDVNGPVKWAGFIVFIVGIIWSVNSYGKQVDYNSTFGNYFAHGFKVSAVVTILMIIYLVIFIALFPDFKEKMLEQTRAGMRQNDKMTEEQITQAMEISRKFFMVGIIGFTLLGYLFVGAIASLIGAAITKKQPNKFVADTNQIIK